MTNTTRIALNISGHGMYQFDADVFDLAMTRTRADLYREVRDSTEGMGITGWSKLRKHELAAVVAEWDTAERDNQREAERYQNMCKLEKGSMTCLSPKGHEGECTDLYGHRFVGGRVESMASYLNRRDNGATVRTDQFGDVMGWPTEEDHADAVSAFDDGDASDVLATWGDLRATLTEARGWLSDIDVRDVDLRSDSEVIHLVQRMYGGGLAEFVLNTVML